MNLYKKSYERKHRYNCEKPNWRYSPVPISLLDHQPTATDEIQSRSTTTTIDTGSTSLSTPPPPDLWKEVLSNTIANADNQALLTFLASLNPHLETSFRIEERDSLFQELSNFVSEQRSDKESQTSFRNELLNEIQNTESTIEFSNSEWNFSNPFATGNDAYEIY